MTGRELYEKRHPYGVRWVFLSRPMKRHFDREARAMSGLMKLEIDGALWRARPGGADK